jgi:NAD(P)-dependent dehydrogenase (short-subunit alcohol dehydrogenase family)
MSAWLITGCSTGLVRALAETALAAGDNVVATARDVSTVADLADIAPDRVLAWRSTSPCPNSRHRLCGRPTSVSVQSTSWSTTPVTVTALPWKRRGR